MTSSFPQTLADLDQAASGTALFDADTANKPDGVTGPGTVNTIYRDDIGWQMLIVNDAPREFWQRTRNRLHRTGATGADLLISAPSMMRLMRLYRRRIMLMPLRSDA
jgi:hypothetical protein